MIKQKDFCAPILPEETRNLKVEVKGDIEFKDVVLSYRQGLSPALNGLSLTIKEGEKIGIIGKTGAGKSTLLKSLIKIVSEYQGEILIGGREIKDIPLLELRGGITVIP